MLLSLYSLDHMLVYMSTPTLTMLASQLCMKQITLMAGEVQYIPFVYQDFEPLRGEQQDSITQHKQRSSNNSNSTAAPSCTVVQVTNNYIQYTHK
jgi:hypothetical protein